ncbi:MAG: tetratricopeptide repeat protein [Planctomycetes bacterium]|nr:tetratricopeptide repeat protein [Planctomycetota bacterium]
MHAEDAYLFRHGLLRDAAYELQPKGDRAALHTLILNIFEELFPDKLDDFALELADHANGASQAPAHGKRTTSIYTRRELNYLNRAASVSEKNYRMGDCIMIAERMLKHPAANAQERVEAHLLKGRTLLHMGRSDECEQSLTKARALAESSDQPVLLSQALTQLGNLARATTRSQEALQFFNEAYEVATSAGMESASAALGGIAMMKGLVGDLSAAEDAFASALKREPRASVRARMLYNLATTRQTAGRWKESEEGLRQALKLTQECGDRDLEGIVRSGMAILLKMLGRKPEALLEYRNATSLLTASGNLRHLGIVRGNLGEMLSELGELDQAAGELRAALDIHLETGDLRFQANVLTSLGSLAATRNRDAEARDYYEQAVTRHRQAGNTRGLGVALHNLASTEEETGCLDRALELREQALEMLSSIDDPLRLAFANGAMAALQCLLGQADRVLPAARQAFAVLARSGVPTLTAEYGVMPVLRCELALGNRAAAERMIRELESLTNDTPDAGLEQFLAGARKALSVPHHSLFNGFVFDDLPEPLQRALIAGHGARVS